MEGRFEEAWSQISELSQTVEELRGQIDQLQNVVQQSIANAGKTSSGDVPAGMSARENNTEESLVWDQKSNTERVNFLSASVEELCTPPTPPNKRHYKGVCDFQPLLGWKNEKILSKSTNVIVQDQPTRKKSRSENTKMVGKRLSELFFGLKKNFRGLGWP